MGVGVNSSNSHSSGTNSYSSNPVNLQNQAYQDLAGGVAGGLSSLFGGQPSPTQNQGYSYYTPQSNPFVAPVTGSQSQFLDYVGGLANPGEGTINNQAAKTAWRGTDYANSNPLQSAFENNSRTAQTAQNGWGQAQQQAGYAAGTANNNYGAAYQGVGEARNTANNSYNQAYQQVGNAQNTANYGYGGAQQQAQYAGGTANNITGVSFPWYQAAGNTTGNLTPAYQQAGRYLDPNYPASLANSPTTQSVVQGAINPILQSFNSQTIPGLQGAFTSAGQRLGNASGGLGGSSAFDIAGANALTGLGANLGATASSIINPTYQTGLGQQANAVNQINQLVGTQAGIYNQVGQNAANTQAQQSQAQLAAGLGQGQLSSQQSAAQLASGLGQGQLASQQSQSQLAAGLGQGQLASQQSAAQLAAGMGQGQLSAQAVQAQNQTAEEQRALVAQQIGNYVNTSSNAQGIVSQQLNNVINGLNANSLPQMTQQYGINQGLQLYQGQVNQLMTALGLGGQVSQPAIGNVAKGGGTQSSGSKGGGISV